MDMCVYLRPFSFVIWFIVYYVIHSTTFGWQTFGWTPQEAKMHMVADYFSPSEVWILS